METVKGARGEQREASVWMPLRRRTFAILWMAMLASNIGNWMAAATAAWQMTLLAPSPMLVSLVQAALNLPVLLFALPAGALSDIVDRRRLLLGVQLFAMVVVLALGVTTQWGRVTPWGLLLFSFAAGSGIAFSAPAWQAMVPELVSRRELLSAISLNVAGVNIARALGPALAGILIAMVALSVPYFVDALSFVGIIAALALWRYQRRRASELPSERLLGAARAGLRYARRSKPLRDTLVRALAFCIFASAYWALLPLVAHVLLRGDAALYGALLGSIGVGAFCGTFALPTLRHVLGPDRVVAVSTIATAGAMAVFAVAPDKAAVAVACWLAGVAWIAALSSLNVSAQVSLPDWVKARGLSVYLAALFGSLTLGSIVWGQLAELVGLRSTLLVAAGLSLFAAAWARRWRLNDGKALNLAPSLHWPAPIVEGEADHDRGPVLVSVEYRINPDEATAFLSALYELSFERRRDGAFFWNVFEDVSQRGRYVEYFMVESWVEHLRQHERVTESDRLLESKVRSFHHHAQPPQITHLLAAERHNQPGNEAA